MTLTPTDLAVRFRFKLPILQVANERPRFPLPRKILRAVQGPFVYAPWGTTSPLVPQIFVKIADKQVHAVLPAPVKAWDSGTGATFCPP